MAQQERAIRTRRVILEGAAEVFDEYGYDAASVREILARIPVTKGALYFHFPSKEHLARGVLAEQTTRLAVPPHPSPIQQMVDLSMSVARALEGDAVLRAGRRLAIERSSVDFSAASPLRAWADVGERLLAEGQVRGEVLPQIDPMATAELFISCITGIQTYSQSSSRLNEFVQRVSVMWQHLLPALAAPGVIRHIDVSPERAHRLAGADAEETAQA